MASLVAWGDLCDLCCGHRWATELEVRYHLTVWVVSRSTFEEVVCWGRFRVDSFMKRMLIVWKMPMYENDNLKNKSKIWIRHSETKSRSTRVFLDEQLRGNRKHIISTRNPVFAFFCFQHENFISSFQDCCQQNYIVLPASSRYHFHRQVFRFWFKFVLIGWYTTSLLASQFRTWHAQQTFRKFGHRCEAVGQPLPGHHWCWRHCRSQWGP